MILIPNKTLLKLGLHILSMGYLEDSVSCFIKITKPDNIGFDPKMVKDEDGKENDKEAVIDSKEKASRKKAQCKAKRDVAWVLLLIAMPRLSDLMSASVLMPGLSAAMLESSIPTFISISISGLFTVVSKLSAAVLKLFAAVPGLFVAVPRLFAGVPEFSSVVPKLFVAITKLSVAVPGFSPAASASVFMLRLSILVLLSAFALMLLK